MLVDRASTNQLLITFRHNGLQENKKLHAKHTKRGENELETTNKN